MLMMSPEVVAEYRRRYAGMPSVIASSMARRPIVRPADLAFIGTTSLYGQRPCQYDRVTFPHMGADGKRVVLRYEYLGRTQGLGTFHFGEQTVKDMGLLLLAQSRNTLSPVGERAGVRGLSPTLAARPPHPRPLSPNRGEGRTCDAFSLVCRPRSFCTTAARGWSTGFGW